MTDPDFKPVSRVHVWPDLWFTCVATLTSEVWLEFKLYRIEAQGGYDGGGAPSYSDGTLNGRTEDLEKAAEFAHGNVKWDGCSDWFWDAYEHFCSREMLDQVGQAHLRIWDLGKTEIPGWMA